MKKLVLTLAILTGVATLTGCSVTAHTNEVSEQTPHDGGSENTDPRDGWVTVTEPQVGNLDEASGYITVFKRCDGSTLMYVSTGSRSGAHSISTIPQSPECLE